MEQILRCVLVLCTLLLSACAMTPEHEARVEKQQRYFAAAYTGAGRYAVSVGQAHWGLPAGNLDVLWRIPQGRAVAPLVVYLPGLGESVQEGAAWQQAWSEAGYAVLALQAPKDGKDLYQTSEARAGSFLGLTQRAYAPEALEQRQKAIAQALQYLRLVIQSGDERFAAIDLEHVALAGFDLGAHTAQALAGVAPMAGMLKVSALISISPYAQASNVPKDFAGIDVPLLSISGPLDEDPFSRVENPQMRLKVWQGVSTAGSCHLWLNEVTHATLSGKLLEFMPSPEQGRSGGQGFAPEGRPMGPGGGGGPSGGRGGGPGGKEGEMDGRGFKPGAFAGQEANAQQVAAIQAVSLAFLDARLSQQSAADEWLKQKARPWLDGQGSLAFK